MPISILENEIPNKGPVGVTEESGNRTVRRIKVKYEHLSIGEVKRRLLGYTVYEDDGTLTRYLPWRDPYEESQHIIRIDHQAVGYKDRNDPDDHDLGMITALAPIDWHATLHFATLPYPVGTGEHSVVPGEEDYIIGDFYADETTRYCTKTINPGREFFNPPRGALFIGGTQLNIPLPVMLPFGDIEVTWHQIPIDPDPEFSAYPKTSIENCLGLVNNEGVSLPAMPDGQIIYPANTLHFYAVRPQLVYQSDGSYAVNITYSFRYRGGLDRNGSQITWNKAPDATDAWFPLTRDAAQLIPFLNSANFTNLFNTEFLYVPPPVIYG